MGRDDDFSDDGWGDDGKNVPAAKSVKPKYKIAAPTKGFGSRTSDDRETEKQTKKLEIVPTNNQPRVSYFVHLDAVPTPIQTSFGNLERSNNGSTKNVNLQGTFNYNVSDGCDTPSPIKKTLFNLEVEKPDSFLNRSVASVRRLGPKSGAGDEPGLKQESNQSSFSSFEKATYADGIVEKSTGFGRSYGERTSTQLSNPKNRRFEEHNEVVESDGKFENPQKPATFGRQLFNSFGSNQTSQTPFGQPPGQHFGARGPIGPTLQKSIRDITTLGFGANSGGFGGQSVSDNCKKAEWGSDSYGQKRGVDEYILRDSPSKPPSQQFGAVSTGFGLGVKPGGFEGQSTSGNFQKAEWSSNSSGETRRVDERISRVAPFKPSNQKFGAREPIEPPLQKSIRDITPIGLSGGLEGKSAFGNPKKAEWNNGVDGHTSRDRLRQLPNQLSGAIGLQKQKSVLDTSTGIGFGTTFQGFGAKSGGSEGQSASAFGNPKKVEWESSARDCPSLSQPQNQQFGVIGQQQLLKPVYDTPTGLGFCTNSGGQPLFGSPRKPSNQQFGDSGLQKQRFIPDTSAGIGFGSSSEGFGAKSGVFGAKTEEFEGKSGFGSPKKDEWDSSCHTCGVEGHIARDCPSKPIRDNLCRNCQQDGHFARNCPEPRVERGACFNCGQTGHSSRECTNERVEREPTQPCRRCGEEGHWSRDCPSRPRDLEGNIIEPFEPKFVADEDLFENNEDVSNLMNYEQEVTVSMAVDNMPAYKTFEEFEKLPDAILRNLERMGYRKPTAIQRAAFYPIFNGQDVLGSAHTGCGKTAAFLLPILTRLVNEDWNEQVREEISYPRCLIIAPTRELALQTFHMCRQMTFGTGVTTRVAYGGTMRTAELQNLRDVSKLGILVATMGRLKDYVNSEAVSLAKTRFIVLDEADRMVDANDFGNELAELLGDDPPSKRDVQLVLFSASFAENVQTQLNRFVKNDYLMLTVNKFGTANRDINQHLISLDVTEKKSKLLEILGIDPLTFVFNDDARVLKEKTLIFVNAIKYCDTLATFLSECGASTISMHSMRGQEQREATLQEFKSGKFHVMVASNVAARGLDIRGLNHVINYDMPSQNDFDEYVNRIGRTGRAGYQGESTSFYCSSSDFELAPRLVECLREAQQEVPEWLENDQIAEVDDEKEEW